MIGRLGVNRWSRRAESHGGEEPVYELPTVKLAAVQEE